MRIQIYYRGQAMSKDEWCKEKCKRCGVSYTHLSGYCSIYCRDTSEHEEEVKELQIELEQLKKQHKNLCKAHVDLIDIEQETEEENAKLKKQWEELMQFIGRMYLNGKISAESSGPIFAKMKELEAQDG